VTHSIHLSLRPNGTATITVGSSTVTVAKVPMHTFFFSVARDGEGVVAYAKALGADLVAKRLPLNRYLFLLSKHQQQEYTWFYN
jgi:hypothetical protein